jgi:propanol-preferring alcohol dehydrogenase
MPHKRGTMSLVGLPPGDFPLPIFGGVLNSKTVRGSIVGTRADLIKSLAFACDGLVKSHDSTERLDNISQIFERIKAGAIDGPVVVAL